MTSFSNVISLTVLNSLIGNLTQSGDSPGFKVVFLSIVLFGFSFPIGNRVAISLLIMTGLRKYLFSIFTTFLLRLGKRCTINPSSWS